MYLGMINFVRKIKYLDHFDLNFEPLLYTMILDF